MRAYQIINSYRRDAGGAELLAHGLHNKLNDNNVSSFLIGLSDKEAGDSKMTALANNTIYSLRALRSVLKFISKNILPGDIIHAHLSPCLFYCALAKGISGKKFHLIATEHHTHNNRRGKWLGKLVDRLTYPKMDAVVCISQGVENSLHAWMPCTKNKTVVIPNGIERMFDRIPNRPQRDSVTLLSASRLHPSKNHASTLKALSQLEGSWTYQIAGTGDLEAELRALVNELGLEERVHFLGHVAEMKPLLEAADIFINASAWEGFGLAAVEAMHAGLPVVASDIPGLRELQDDGPPCLLLADPNSPTSIRHAIQQLMQSETKRRVLGQHAHQRAEAFTMDQMVYQHIKLYKSLSLHT